MNRISQTQLGPEEQMHADAIKRREETLALLNKAIRCFAFATGCMFLAVLLLS